MKSYWNLLVGLMLVMTANGFANELGVSLRWCQVDPFSSTKWLPTSSIPVECESTQVTGIAAKDHTSTVSILLRNTGDESLKLQLPDKLRLVNESGAVLTGDVRYVQSWYQGPSAWQSLKQTSGDPILVPELLVKDPRLVRPVMRALDNEIRVGGLNSTESVYGRALGRLMADRHDRVQHPTRLLEIRDAETLQILDLAAQTLRQIWVEFEVPPGAAEGAYRGDLKIVSHSSVLESLPMLIEVLPLKLASSPLEYTAYYRGKLHRGEPLLSSERKVRKQLKEDFLKLRQHGVTGLSIYDWYQSGSDYQQFLADYGEAGFSDKNFFVIDSLLSKALTEGDGHALQSRINRVKRHLSPYGYDNVYVYGVDEPSQREVQEQLSGWKKIREENLLVFTAGRREQIKRFFSHADLFVVAYQPAEELARSVQDSGGRIFSYADPQVGVENPHVYRRNYGLALYLANYDGAMLYAFQDGRGSIWNDFDGKYRDMVFAYPSADGLIETIAFAGFREATYDVRFLASLKEQLSRAKQDSCGMSDEVAVAEQVIESVRTLIETDLRAARRAIIGAIRPLLRRSEC